MRPLKCQEVIQATNGVLVSGEIKTEFGSISTDSRKMREGSLFIPIIGEKFDGHDFIRNSFEAGALGTLTQKESVPAGGRVVIKVESTMKAMHDLARYYRQKFRIPFVGVTGSVGKTSTKDMIAGVLGQKFNVLKTAGNYNNEVGLPLTIFNLDSFHEAAVIEMGMSGFGEIRRLTSIAKPDIAVITNIGLSHIEKLGSRQNILKAKMEILEGLDRSGLVVLNGDDKLLYGLKDLLKFRTVFFGMEDGLDYQAYNIKNLGENGISFETAVGNKEYKVHIPVPGLHNVHNALAAIAVGIELGMSMEKVISGIGEFSQGNMRLNIVNCGKIKIINDTYNASPQSMEAAISVLKDLGGKSRTIAVLGDMLEMGDWAYKAHLDVGRFAVSKEVNYIVTVGQHGKNIAEGAMEAGASKSNVFFFENNDEAVQFLQGFVKDGDVILVKGSRGMKMEQVVEGLTKHNC
ncbi:MAG: UDP-N-acetylmuramoyl-tripeptide--D-alanyl-D-alanine ligase [Clostridiales bacterium]|jgi:UDP-N-acetylmuramoyl-tripeptide--D-alanyl-D-alanine ligase|nr:UDP-N-acetylmuramoyl-tripeptide--D-alanyl-D-alanine ligase [Eubacteriales bacterium]MDH7564933.1 UDP-N-acetylmuramoyl-tripeptide--D-alanyl-D-alanine ligase [Clostridiales bacterium]